MSTLVVTDFDLLPMNILTQLLQVDTTVVVDADRLDGKSILLVQDDNEIDNFTDILFALAGGSDFWPEDLDKKIRKQLEYRTNNLFTQLQSTEKKKLLPSLHKFNKLLETQVYLVDNVLTVCDVVTYPLFFSILEPMNNNERFRLENIVRWFNNLQHHPDITDLVEILDLPQEQPKPQPKKKKGK
eukprot:TRINITY_DN4583_c0_g1_i1.p1 TRINITY_DN4583_c0_g1~~TRINITY_DN4583_c0_g1_i1.p1  ORF type:complete len:185 (-),score=48.06 TRINITY_DN4583_c0_g1_i1:38-592(-)